MMGTAGRTGVSLLGILADDCDEIGYCSTESLRLESLHTCIAKTR